MKLFLVGLIITTVTARMMWINHATAFRQPICAASGEQMDRLLSAAQNLVSNPSDEVVAYRAGLHLPQLRPSEVFPVHSDSLCALAGIMLNRDAGRPDTTSIQVYLVSLAKWYWAEEPTRHNAWQVGLVLDSTLSHVISAVGR